MMTVRCSNSLEDQRAAAGAMKGDAGVRKENLLVVLPVLFIHAY